MTATYTDYNINVDNARWPTNDFTQSHPHQYYNNHGPDLYAHNITTEQISPYLSNLNNNQYQYLHPHQQPNSEQARPVAIRRHKPGSTDPPTQQPISIVRLAPILQPTPQQIPSEPVPRSAPVRNHPPVLPLALDPTDRPIKPMKDTSIYNNPLPSEKSNPPKKPLSPLKPIQSSSRCESGIYQLPPKPVRPPSYNQSDRLQSAPKPVRYPPQNHSERVQSASKLVPSSPIHRPDLFPLPPSRVRINVSARRPIQTNIKTLFDDDLPPPPPRNGRRLIPMRDYQSDDNNYPVVYIRSAPKRMISYPEVHLMAAEEMQNYRVPKTRRIIRPRLPPVETIVYRT